MTVKYTSFISAKQQKAGMNQEEKSVLYFLYPIHLFFLSVRFYLLWHSNYTTMLRYSISPNTAPVIRAHIYTQHTQHKSMCRYWQIFSIHACEMATTLTKKARHRLNERNISEIYMHSHSTSSTGLYVRVCDYVAIDDGKNGFILPEFVCWMSLFSVHFFAHRIDFLY